MANTCSICKAKERAKIEQDIINGVSLRNIAKRYNVGYSAVNRHKEHIPLHLVKADQAREAAQAGDLLAEMRALQIITLDILSQAENAGDLRTALYGVSQARGNTELLCKMLAHLEEREQRQQDAGQDNQAKEDWNAIKSLATDPDFLAVLQDAVDKYDQEAGQG